MNNSPYNLYEEVMHPGKLFFEDETRDGFYVWTMMKRFWAAQLKVLAEIDRICQKHNLKWFADNGTLLGAIRHGGYIPWDDDLDICMMRDDYEVFMEYAHNELPKGYDIMTLRDNEEYRVMIGRVNSTRFIDNSDAHLAKHFGCPYLVGVDIFPLDGIYKDERKEEERCKWLDDIGQALFLIENHKRRSVECQDLITKIEKTHNVRLNRMGDIHLELMHLADKIYRLCPTSDADYVVLMPYWISKHNHKYEKKWFEKTVYVPFEYIHVPVPAYYEEVLTVEFWDYMKVIKGGGGHEYPLYKPQEEDLDKAMGENAFRYTMPTELLPARESNDDFFERCGEIIGMLSQVAGQINTLTAGGNTDMASQLADGCQNLADSLDSIVRERLEVDEAYSSSLNAFVKSLRKKEVSAADTLQSVCDEINRLYANRKKEVLFLPVKADWWHTMEPEWRKAREDPNNDVHVMPLLYLEKDFVEEKGEEHNDSALFPEYVELTDIADYDIAKHKPDMVYIQDPYDGFNTMLAIPSYFYSQNLLQFTDELIYVPCFETDDPEDEDDKIIPAMKLLAEQPAVYYADRVLIPSEKQRDVYIDALTEITGEDTREYWESKIEVSDAKVKYPATKPAEPVPEAWEERVGEGRKILLYQVNSSFIIKYRADAINKIKNTLETIKKEKDNLVCVFSPHESLDYASEQILGGKLYNSYVSLIESVGKDPDFILDEDHLANESYGCVNAYYGNTGTLAYKCHMNDIPVMIMNAEL